jgi:low affinity Fe/Cu permease
MEHNKKKPNKELKEIFGVFSTWVTKATGSPSAFLIALLIVLVWGITGPIFNFFLKCGSKS